LIEAFVSILIGKSIHPHIGLYKIINVLPKKPLEAKGYLCITYKIKNPIVAVSSTLRIYYSKFWGFPDFEKFTGKIIKRRFGMGRTFMALLPTGAW